MLFHDLPYSQDSFLLFEKIADRPWSVFLDSCTAFGTNGRYDILAAEPAVTLVTRGDATVISTQYQQERSHDDPLLILGEWLSHFETASDNSLPFCGGAIGYFSYDLSSRLSGTVTMAKDELELPEMAVALYGWAVVVDHHEKRSVLVGQTAIPGINNHWAGLVDLFSSGTGSGSSGSFEARGAIRSNMDEVQYRNAFNRINHYLTEGDCYQVNLAQRFSCGVAGAPLEGYRRLRHINPAPYSAYLNLPFVNVLSSSPELFLQCEGGHVVTSPIKGTRPRSEDPDQDAALAEALRTSAKDRAENLMIVDLLRNDLGHVCKPGSIRVSELFQIRSFASVHHMVSTITGELDAGKSSLELFRNCFPGGSITGAPKIRAMQIIDELEPDKRSIYCGSIGYIGFDGQMVTNIAIRTLLLKDEVAYYWAGGGIVIDSDWQGEYQESFDKAAALFSLMGNDNG